MGLVPDLRQRDNMLGDARLRDSVDSVVDSVSDLRQAVEKLRYAQEKSVPYRAQRADSHLLRRYINLRDQPSPQEMD